MRQGSLFFQRLWYLTLSPFLGSRKLHYTRSVLSCTPVPEQSLTPESPPGTHVTGTIGALANSYGFSGAAPAATLGHYRVFGCTGETTDDLVLAAVQRAVLVDKVDIISLSLGSSVGWLDNTPIQIYQDYLATIGVHIVAAAGNERTEGLFYSEQPAAGLLTNAVGATYDTSVSFVWRSR